MDDEFDPAALRRPSPVGDLGDDYPRTEVAYHNHEIRDNLDGTFTCYDVTNDDNDDGYPDGTVESWDATFPSKDAALKHAGKSRGPGTSTPTWGAVTVNVYLDGARIE